LSPHILCAFDSVTALANSSPGIARGDQRGATRGPSQVGGSLEKPHAIGRVLAKEVATARSPCHPPSLEGKQNRIIVSLQSCRNKPHGIWSTIARDSQSSPPAHRVATTACLRHRRPVQPHRPLCLQRPRLDRRTPSFFI
jgi:hypothetical protein